MSPNDGETCPRCNRFWRKCLCEERLHPLLPRYQREDRYEIDEELAFEYEREQSLDPPKTWAYWKGYNLAVRKGTRTTIRCSLSNPQSRKDFYRGVSDARFER